MLPCHAGGTCKEGNGGKVSEWPAPALWLQVYAGPSNPFTTKCMLLVAVRSLRPIVRVSSTAAALATNPVDSDHFTLIKRYYTIRTERARDVVGSHKPLAHVTKKRATICVPDTQSRSHAGCVWLCWERWHKPFKSTACSTCVRLT